MDAVACVRCPGRKFKTANALHQHKTSAKGHPYCAACQSDFTDSNALLEHAVGVHPSTTCVTCKRLFESSDSLDNHFAESPRHPKCELCRLGFRDKGLMREHKKQVHAADVQTKGDRNTHFKDKDNASSASSSDSCISTSTIKRQEEKQREGSTASAIDIVQEDNFGDERVRGIFNSDLKPDANSDIQSEAMQSDIGAKAELQAENKDCSVTNISREDDAGLDAALAEGIENLKLEEESLLSDLEELSSKLASGSFLDDEDDTLLDSGSDLFFGTKGGPFRRRWDQSPYLSSPRVINATRLPPSTSSPSLLNRHIHQGQHTETEASSDGVEDSAPSSMRSMHDSWHVSRPPSLASSSPDTCRILSPSTHGRRLRLNLNPPSTLTTIHDEPESDDETEETSREQETPLDNLLSNSLLDDSIEMPLEWQSSQPSALEPIVELDEDEGRLMLLSSPRTIENSSRVGRDSACGYDVEFSRVPSANGFDEDTRSSEDDHGSSEQSSCPSPPKLVVEDLTRLALELASPTSNAAYSEDGDGTDAESLYFDPFDLHPSRAPTPISATFPKRPRAWSFESNLRVPDYDNYFHDDYERSDDQNQSSTEEEGAVGADEIAPALDEAPPADIEVDLFSDEDDSGHPDEDVLTSPVTVFESMSSDNSPNAGGSQIPCFAEDNHPLESLITLGANVHQANDLQTPVHRQLSPVANEDALSAHDERAPSSTPSSPVPLEDNTLLSVKCRICHKTPPRADVSATFCGHVFCSPCITDEVMARSRCPICSTPTLLYCIFKLDL